MFLQAYSTDERDYINKYENFTFDEKGFHALGKFTGEELNKNEGHKVVIKRFNGNIPGPKEGK